MATITELQPASVRDPLSLANWRTSDEDEINRRRQRARDEAFIIWNTDPQPPVARRLQEL